jgi:hypothetical protein
VATTRERLDIIEQKLGIEEEKPAPPPKEAQPRSPRRRTNWLWRERNWVFGVAAALFIPGVGVGWHFTGLELDKRVETKVGEKLAPIKDDLAGTHKDIQTISGNVQEIKGIVSVLQAEMLASKYSRASKDELRSNRDVLSSVKRNLATAPKDTPNFWPASFQIINLLSQAEWELETVGRQPLQIFNNVQFINATPNLVKGKNVALRNVIEGMRFENSVIHFDSSVELYNVGFSHCVFVFPSEPNPPQRLQQIGQVLLTSDLTNVRFDGG